MIVSPLIEHGNGNWPCIDDFPNYMVPFRSHISQRPTTFDDTEQYFADYRNALLLPNLKLLASSHYQFTFSTRNCCVLLLYQNYCPKIITLSALLPLLYTKTIAITFNYCVQLCG